MHLADLGDRAFTPVLSVLADAKHRDRAAAALIIGINGQWGTNRVRAVPVLLECLHAQDEQVAGCAAIALGRLALQPDLVVPELEKSLSDRRAIVRRGAVWSLGVFAGRAPSVGPSLIQALGDTDRSVRVVATNAVREIAPDVLRAVELRQIQEGIGKSETKDPSP